MVKRNVMENGQEVDREEHDNLLFDGSYSAGSEIKDGYPEFTLGVLKKLSWDTDLTAQELAIIHQVRPCARHSIAVTGNPHAPLSGTGPKASPGRL